MNPAQLSALFAQHKTAALGAAALGVAGLALMKRKKAAATGTASTSPAGTIPAAGVAMPSSGVQGTYPNTTATDVYNSLEPTLEQILNQNSAQTSGGNAAPLSAPAPVASGLFAPTYNGNYAVTGDGQPVEIESDGSLFHLNNVAWGKVSQSGVPLNTLAASPGWYSTTGNLQAVQAGVTPGLMHYDSSGNLTNYTPPTATPAKT